MGSSRVRRFPLSLTRRTFPARFYYPFDLQGECAASVRREGFHISVSKDNIDLLQDVLPIGNAKDDPVALRRPEKKVRNASEDGRFLTDRSRHSLSADDRHAAHVEFQQGVSDILGSFVFADDNQQFHPFAPFLVRKRRRLPEVSAIAADRRLEEAYFGRLPRNHPFVSVLQDCSDLSSIPGLLEVPAQHLVAEQVAQVGQGLQVLPGSFLAG